MQSLKKPHLIENIMYETNNLYASTRHADFAGFPANPFASG